MSVSILEALQNADCNLNNDLPFTRGLAKNQLHNAVRLLLKGYKLSDQVEPLLERYGNVNNVPDKK